MPTPTMAPQLQPHSVYRHRRTGRYAFTAAQLPEPKFCMEADEKLEADEIADEAEPPLALKALTDGERTADGRLLSTIPRQPPRPLLGP